MYDEVSTDDLREQLRERKEAYKEIYSEISRLEDEIRNRENAEVKEIAARLSPAQKLEIFRQLERDKDVLRLKPQPVTER